MIHLYKLSGYLLIYLQLSGCVSGHLPNIPPSAKINFEVVNKGEMPDASIDSEITEEHAEIGAMSGSGAGALAAIPCGPFFLLCSIITVPVGILTGTVTGHISGELSSLPAKKKSLLIKRLNESQKEVDFRSVVLERLNSKANSRYIISKEADSVTFLIKFTDVTFNLAKRERIKLLLTAEVSLSKADKNRLKARNSNQVFYFTGKETSVDQWIYNENNFIYHQFEQGIDDITTNIVSAISQ